MQTLLTRLGNKTHALATLCGHSSYCSTNEPYFFEAAYNFYNHSTNMSILLEALVLNEIEQAINLFPDIDSKAKTVNWKCNHFCKTIDASISIELKNLFEEIENLEFKNASKYLQSYDQC